MNDRPLQIGSLCRLLAATVLVGIWAAPAAAQSKTDDGKMLGNQKTSQESCPTDIEASRASSPRELTLLGVSCFKNERYAQAYTFYHRAFLMKESSLLMAAMGRSLHELGLYGAAEHYYRDFLEAESGSSTDKIEKRLAQLEEDVSNGGGTVEFSTFPTNAEIHVRLDNGDWVEIGATPSTAKLEAGSYQFAFDREGYRRRRLTHQVTAGSEAAPLDVQLYREGAAMNLTARGWKRAGGFTSLAAAPLLGVGALYFGLAADKFNEAEDYTFSADYVPADQNKMIDQGHRLQRTAIGFGVAGGVTLITGTILYFTGVGQMPKPDNSAGETETSETKARIQPVVSPTGVGLMGRF